MPCRGRSSAFVLFVSRNVIGVSSSVPSFPLHCVVHLAWWPSNPTRSAAACPWSWTFPSFPRDRIVCVSFHASRRSLHAFRCDPRPRFAPPSSRDRRTSCVCGGAGTKGEGVGVHPMGLTHGTNGSTMSFERGGTPRWEPGPSPTRNRPTTKGEKGHPDVPWLVGNGKE